MLSVKTCAPALRATRSIGSIFAVSWVVDYVLDLLAVQLAYDEQADKEEAAHRRSPDRPVV